VTDDAIHPDEWVFAAFKTRTPQTLSPSVLRGWESVVYIDSQRRTLGYNILIIYNNVLKFSEIENIFYSMSNRPLLILFHESQWAALDERLVRITNQENLLQRNQRHELPNLPSVHMRGLIATNTRPPLETDEVVLVEEAKSMTTASAKPKAKPGKEQTTQDFFWADLSYKRALFHILLTGRIKRTDLAKRVTLLPGESIEAVVKRLLSRGIVVEKDSALVIDEGIAPFLRKLFEYEFCAAPNLIETRVNPLFADGKSADALEKLVSQIFRDRGIDVVTRQLSDDDFAAGFLSTSASADDERIAFYIVQPEKIDVSQVGLKAISLSTVREQRPNGRYRTNVYLPVLIAPAFGSTFMNEAEKSFGAAHLLDAISLLQIECLPTRYDAAERLQIADRFAELFARSGGGLLDVEVAIDGFIDNE
jgi:hypothetical protein